MHSRECRAEGSRVSKQPTVSKAIRNSGSEREKEACYSFAISMRTSFAHLALTFGLVLTCSAFADDAAVHVPVAKLLRSPKEFDGKLVTVSGFYLSGYEHSALYVDRREFWRQSERPLWDRSIWIEFTDERAKPGKIVAVNEGNIQVTGTFHYQPEHIRRTQLGFGQNAAWPMEIHELTELRPLKKKVKK